MFDEFCAFLKSYHSGLFSIDDNSPNPADLPSIRTDESIVNVFSSAVQRLACLYPCDMIPGLNPLCGVAFLFIYSEAIAHNALFIFIIISAPAV